jgi:NarL family two-component system response regulator LiaR
MDTGAIMIPKKRIRILIVDDHQVVRQGFAVFLKAFEEFELIGEAVDGEDALRQCARLVPDVILMDMIMPKMDGPTAIKEIRKSFPRVQIIGLTSFSDNKELVQRAMEAGAIGYLFKDVSIDELATAIRAAHKGDPTLAPEAMRMLISAKTTPEPRKFNLTEREMDVLDLLAEGLNNPEIGERLFLSRSTVKFHVSSILGKLGASTRTEAVSIALQNKIINK